MNVSIIDEDPGIWFKALHEEDHDEMRTANEYEDYEGVRGVGKHVAPPGDGL